MRSSFFLGLLALTTNGYAQTIATNLPEEAVHSMCAADVIMVGEPSHGLQEINDIRSRVAELLIERCKPDSVLFEGSFYEFANLKRTAARGKVSSKQILEAIGPFARNSDGMARLSGLLAQKGTHSTITVHGLDFQLGTLGHDFTNKALPELIARASPWSLRAKCIAQLTGPMQGSGAIDETVTRQCLDKFGRSKQSSLYQGELRNLGAVLAAWIQPRSAFAQHRSLAMFANLLLSSTLPDRKVLVLAHNSHVSNGTGWRGTYAENDNLGALLRNAGFNVYSLAITTRWQTFHNYKGELVKAEGPGPDSLEAAATCNGDLAYLDREALSTAGEKASVLDNLQPSKFAWASAFDGVLVTCRHSAP